MSTATVAIRPRRQVEVGGLDIHGVEAGTSNGRDFLLLHGWPEDSSIFWPLLDLLGSRTRAVAIDLPGIGASKIPPKCGEKRGLAHWVSNVIRALGLRDVTLVGHDVGGQIAYACLRISPVVVGRVALMNIVIPGIDPWDKVIHNPHLWHFAFHGVAGLPATLVADHVGEYFAFFFDRLAGPNGVSALERERYAAAYADRTALQTGFDWYRAFSRDAEENRRDFGKPVHTPVLCLRGDKETGAVAEYVEGLRRAGCGRVDGVIIADCGHFSPSEQPALVAAELQRFATVLGGR
ncbi:MAG TPA: alpha/beta hydrolase [Candidatus Didemnitutus sp.]|nr:alpha/beta hydrolase [Candidatus Didemnitutus sp.]